MPENTKESFILYYSLFTQCEKLSNQDFGELVRSLYDYDANGVFYSGSDERIDIVFKGYRPLLDSNKRKYIERCEKNKKIATDAWQKRKKQLDTLVTDNDAEADAADCAASTPKEKPKKCGIPEEMKQSILELLK